MLEKWNTYRPVQTHEADGDEDVEVQVRSRCGSCSPSWRAAFIVLLTLNIICGLWFFMSPHDLAPNTIYLKANSAVTYTKQRIWRPLNDNVYTGKPRPELDQAWRELIRPMAIKIDQSQADRLDADTIAFKDGSGYMAEMAVFHELHCIKRIKQHLSLDYYHPNMTATEAELEDIHIDHCLEYLRRAAMCHGDTSLATFFWKDGKPKTRNWSDHICVDWDKLYGFALENSPLITDHSMIVGPEAVENV